MTYQGFIANSRTLDVLALFGVIESVAMAAQNELANLGLTPTVQSLVRLGLIGVLAFLRFQTTGAVGETK